MTVGGMANKKYVKLYSLDAKLPIPACLKNLKELPDDRFNAAGASLGQSEKIYELWFFFSFEIFTANTEMSQIIINR